MAKKAGKGVDFFICHASEDKEAVARPLAEALSTRGLRVWYDDYTLKVGDSLLQTIDRGIASCRFGVVVLSPRFFARAWPQRELDGLVTRELAESKKLILPVWHEVSADVVRARSAPLADKVAVSTSNGIDYVVDRILDAIRRTPTKTPSRWKDRPVPRYPITAMESWERGIGRSVLSVLLYYQFEDRENLNFEEVVRAIESGQCVVGLDPSVEKTVFQSLVALALSWEGHDPSTILTLDVKRKVENWVYGVFTRWTCRMPNRLHEPKLTFQLDIEEERFEINFFNGDKNVTELGFRSSRFEALDHQVNETLMTVVPLCVPRLATKQLSIERYFINEAENEELGERGLDLAPSIVYVW